MEVAIENIRVGQGDAVFEGLQNGKCTVDISYNGAYIAITAHPINPEKTEAKGGGSVRLEVPLVQTQELETVAATADVPESPEQVEPETKKRRRYTS